VEKLVIFGSEGGGRWFDGFDRNLRSGLVSAFASQRLTMLASKERGEDFQVLRELIDAGGNARAWPVPDAFS
jgi:hypothetical protein